MRVSTVLAASLATFVAAAPTQGESHELTERALPTPVSAATARTYLAALTTAAEVTSPAYNRDLFKHWITITSPCDTRETVLKRDGSGVTTDSACAMAGGSWSSAYDSVTTTNASSFDIDHVVPLADAWRSGAWAWTDARRQDFANDLTRPQLIAVSASSNRSKGDQDPAKWLPQASYQCTYARAWVQVKYYYSLTVDSAERSALTSILSGC